MYWVYSIRNLVNDKRYIGITNDLKSRLYHHKYDLLNNRHKNLKLQRAFNKYGFENFEFSMLEELDVLDKNFVAEREIYYINLYDSCDNGYNQTYGGDCYGDRIISESTKIKMSNAMKGNTFGVGHIRTDEQREYYSETWHKSRSEDYLKEHSRRASENLKKLWRTEEFRNKMAELNLGNKYNLGKSMSDNQKKMLSEMRKGENNPFYGKRHTEETKNKIREKSNLYFSNKENKEKHRNSILSFINEDWYRKKQSELSRGRSKKTSELDAITIRYRFLCGERPDKIILDFPKLSLSGLKKICYNYSWNHLPNNKDDLYNMLINYQSKEESLEGLETR